MSNPESASDVLADIAQIFANGTSSDGWDLSVMDEVDMYLRRRGFILPDPDSLSFECDSCGRLGTEDDGCDPYGECPADDCNGITMVTYGVKS